MKILFVGEIVSSPGREAVITVLPDVIEEYKPDLVLSNADNLSGGKGFTEDNILEMIKSGIDYFSGGDHVFSYKETEDIIDRLPVLRGVNYPENTPGKGYVIIDTGVCGNVLFIELLGQAKMSENLSYIDNPFRKIDEILDKFSAEKFSAIIVDFHAELTSEKHAMAFYLDGRVSAILGTHTHVPTCDNRVLPKGTMYVTDVGMTGNLDSVIGVKKDIIIDMFLTGKRNRFEWEKAGTKAFRSVLLNTEEKSIIRVDKIV